MKRNPRLKTKSDEGKLAEGRKKPIASCVGFMVFVVKFSLVSCKCVCCLRLLMIVRYSSLRYKENVIGRLRIFFFIINNNTAMRETKMRPTNTMIYRLKKIK